jgi:hypothetical protein
VGNRFVISVEGTLRRAGDGERLTAVLRELGWEVWRSLDDLWLVRTLDSDVHPRTISDLIKEVCGPQIFFMVLEVAKPASFWGRMPPASWEWMESNWKAGDD